MRCPKCRLVASDKRDICPECLFDMRPEKGRLGIPVSEPGSSYEKLVEQLKVVLAEEREKQARNPKPVVRKKKRRPAPKKKKAQGLQLLLQKFASWKAALPKRKPRPIKENGETEQPVVVAPEPQPNLAAPVQELEASAPPQSETSTSEDLSVPSGMNLDSLEFERLFDEEDELPAEPKPELFSELSAAFDEQLGEMLNATEALRDLPVYKPMNVPAQPIVAPEVLEFGDDDTLLEEQLDEMIGDDLLEFSAVKTNTPKPPIAALESLQVAEDLEISFEFDLGESEEELEDLEEAGEQVESDSQEREEEQESTEFSEEALFAQSHHTQEEFEDDIPWEQQPNEKLPIREVIHEIVDDPLDMVSSLESALNSLEEELEEYSLVEERDDGFDESDLEEELRTASPRESTPLPPLVIPAALRGDPEKLALYLLDYVSRTHGCPTEDLFEKAPAPVTPQIDDDLLEMLSAELDSEVSALTQEGCHIHGLTAQEVRDSAEEPQPPSGYAEEFFEEDDSVDLLPDYATVEREAAEQSIVEMEDWEDEEPESELPPEMSTSPQQEAEPSVELPVSVDEPSEEEIEEESLFHFEGASEAPTVPNLPVVPQAPVVSSYPENPWDIAESELMATQEFEEETFEVSEMLTHTPDERTIVHFDTALAALQDSRVDEAFHTTIQTSVNRELDHTKLEQVFETYGDAALEEFQRHAAEVPPGFEIQEWIAPPRAALWRRPLSFAIDLLFALSVGLLYLWFVELSEPAHALLMQDRMEAWVVLLPHLFSFGAVTLTAYLSLALFIWGRGQTIGQKLVGCRTTSVDDDTVPLSFALLRMCANLTDTCFGFPGVLLVLGSERRTLTDHLSDTSVSALPEPA